MKDRIDDTHLGPAFMAGLFLCREPNTQDQRKATHEADEAPFAYSVQQPVKRGSKCSIEIDRLS